jgi:uncharacterized protein with PQ loop repeat
MISILQMLVFSAIAVGPTRSVPQALRTLRSGSIEGVSPVGFALAGTGSLLWVGWGAAAGEPIQFPGNLIAALCAAAVLFIVYRSGHRSTMALLAASGYAALGAVAFFVFGPLALSLVAACSGVGFALFGLSAYLRSPDRSGVSLWSWGMVTYSELVWLCWGLVYSVPASVISSGTGLLSSLVVLALASRSSRRSACT